MLSKSHLKYFTSLKQKKYRALHGIFLAEGDTLVKDLLGRHRGFLNVQSLLATPSFLDSIRDIPDGINITTVNEEIIKKISSFSTPGQAILEIMIPEHPFNPESSTRELSLLFEDIRDPGNLGTIIRTADWFGISTVFCSHSSVDLYNPKVIQATMGSISRVKVIYIDPEKLIKELKKTSSGFPVYATTLNGKNVFQMAFTSTGLIIFGNEAHGLSEELIRLCDEEITIPACGFSGAESLNVGISAGIISAEFRKKTAIQNGN